MQNQQVDLENQEHQQILQQETRQMQSQGEVDTRRLRMIVLRVENGANTQIEDKEQYLANLRNHWESGKIMKNHDNSKIVGS